MPRRARSRSAFGYMHIIVRGNGKQLLFEDANDYRYYLKKLELYCMQTETRVCAYCLMDNHVHLLVKGKAESVTLLMKKLGVSYSWYYNKKYDRVGHLFQDRYKSEPIENEAYLLAAFRYILKNPQKAGICSVAQYPWNSYRYYDLPLSFMDLSAIKDFLGDFRHDPSYDYLEIAPAAGVTYNSVTHCFIGNSRDSIPLVGWGKYCERDGRIKMPYTLRTHHCFIDGGDIEALINSLNKFMNEECV